MNRRDILKLVSLAMLPVMPGAGRVLHYVQLSNYGGTH
jgi:hypothetical protein